MGVRSLSFKPEFLNRLDEIVMFDALTKDDLAHIVDLQLGLLEKRLAGPPITIHVTDAARAWLAETGYDLGGRRPAAAPADPVGHRRPARPPPDRRRRGGRGLGDRRRRRGRARPALRLSALWCRIPAEAGILTLPADATASKRQDRPASSPGSAPASSRPSVRTTPRQPAAAPQRPGARAPAGRTAGRSGRGRCRARRRRPPRRTRATLPGIATKNAASSPPTRRCCRGRATNAAPNPISTTPDATTVRSSSSGNHEGTCARNPSRCGQVPPAPTIAVPSRRGRGACSAHGASVGGRVSG